MKGMLSRGFNLYRVLLLFGCYFGFAKWFVCSHRERVVQ
ncbi:unnamed protein product, partial [Brassica rapa]